MSRSDRARLLALARRYLPLALPLVLGVLAGGTLAIVIDPDGPNGPQPARTITVKAPTVLAVPADSTGDGKPDATVLAPKHLVEQAADDVEQKLRAENPSMLNQAAQEKAAERDQLPILQTDAAPQQRGCSSRFVVNKSSRRGVAPRLIVLHETVSRNVPGTADVNSVWALFNRPASQASSSYIIDREGHCLYAVRETEKPWTQAAGNPWSISFEIINSANRRYDRNLIDGAGRRKLLGLLNDISKRWGIPLRTGRVSGCVPTRRGIIDHDTFGACGGGHVDVNPFRRSLAPIIHDARRLCVKRYRTAHKRVPARCRT